MNDTDLYKQLAVKIFMPDSQIIPLLFELIADEDEARTLLALPGTVPEVAERLQLPQEHVSRMLAGLFRKGVAFKSEKPEGTKYRMAGTIVQFHDASIVWPEATAEFIAMWRRFMEEEWPTFASMVSQALPKPFARIIPVEQPVEMRQRILAYEDVRELIESTRRVAVTKCTCRLVAGNCDKPIEVCLQVGKGADYTIERESGRELTKEEALRLVRECEEAGLVHVVMNKAGESHFICNCCEDCCMSFTLLISDGFKLCDPSRFLAEVDARSCTACGECEERCYFGALSLDESGVAEID
ncbi:MAG: 4Fe-4S ferredoxin, partial [Deltaproteobacteria bacterium HGW-Deltaproteobacteria-11]